MTTYRQAGAAALSNAMLANAGYSRRGTGEWTIFNCPVTLGDTEQEDFWFVEIQSRLGTITATMVVKDILVESIALKVPRGGDEPPPA
jgi:hypothetical protein